MWKHLKERKMELELKIPNQIICSFYEGNEIKKAVIEIQDQEHIKVEFVKDCVVVSTETETIFMCKEKAFISLCK